MNYSDWICPGCSGAVSAEEFAASCGVSSSSAPCPCSNAQPPCSGELPGCPPAGPVLCWCQPACPAPKPVEVPQEGGCCCKASMRAALQLLCDSRIASLVNFDGAAFVTDTYTAGSPIDTTAPTATPADNLTTLSGSFLRLSACNCDLLDINAPVYLPPETATGLTASQVSLCELAAVAFQVALGTAEGDVTVPEATTRNYRLLKQLLSQRLTPCGSQCGQCVCKCDCGDCCCTAGVLSQLSDSNLSRKATLAAGLLVLQGATLLGTLGNVLVLANDTAQRIYFVCASKVQFLG